MPEFAENFRDLTASIRRSEKLGHASIVLRIGALLDRELRRLLIAAMPTVNKTLEKRLFDGPLQSLSAKIDLAYAFGLTPKADHDQLRVICNIRNAFAHPEGDPNLDEEPIVSLFNRLRVPRDLLQKDASRRSSQFLACAVPILRRLDRASGELEAKKGV